MYKLMGNVLLGIITLVAFSEIKSSNINSCSSHFLCFIEFFFISSSITSLIYTCSYHYYLLLLLCFSNEKSKISKLYSYSHLEKSVIYRLGAYIIINKVEDVRTTSLECLPTPKCLHD